MAAEARITWKPIGIEGPNAMSVGKRYHAPLRKTFLKVRESYSIVALYQEVKPVSGPS